MYIQDARTDKSRALRSRVAPADSEDINFLLSPGDAWEAMYEDCNAASRSIQFEQYIIANDKVGLRFIELFTRKAQQGVAVQLVIDSVGSHALEFSPQLARLREAGGEVLVFNPKRLFHILFPSSWLPRNHAKTMIIDGDIAYVGSVCLSAMMQDWRDLHLRLNGPVVASIADDFREFWNRLINRATRNYWHILPQVSANGKKLRYVIHRPELEVNALYNEMLHRIRTAKSHIRLATPYFLPPGRLRRALYAARERGVKVTVLLSQKTDVPLADGVGRSYFPRLLKHGLRILMYKPSVMHAKYCIIDDNWASIGSTNLDYLSLLYNRETNIVTEDPDLLARLDALFTQDSQNSELATPESWSRMPLTSQLAGYAGRFMRHMM